MQSLQSQLTEMGFSPDQVEEATRRSSGNRDKALAYLMGDGDDLADGGSNQLVPYSDPNAPLTDPSDSYSTTYQAGGLSQQSRPDISSPVASEYSAYSDIPTLRNHGSPGVLMSARNPEVGSVLAALAGVPSLARAMLNDGEDIVVDVGYSPRWWLGAATDIDEDTDKTLEIELARLVAFFNAEEGRLQASVRSFEAQLPPSVFENAADFLKELSKINDLKSQLVTKVVDSLGSPADLVLLRLDADDGSTLDEATDDYFWPNGLSDTDEHPDGIQVISWAPVVAIECNGTVSVVESWYPQRYTEEFKEHLQKLRIVHAQLQKDVIHLRQRRLQLRSFRGADVPRMLSHTKSILMSENESDAVGVLESLESSVNTELEEVLEKIDDMSSKLANLPRYLCQLSPELYSIVDLPPVKSEAYRLSALIFQDSKYYVLYKGEWWYFDDGTPERSSFADVQQACTETAGYLAIYATESSLDFERPISIPPSLSRFLERDLTALETERRAESFSSSLPSRSSSERSIRISHDDMSTSPSPSHDNMVLSEDEHMERPASNI